MSRRVEPLVGFIGVGGRLVISDDREALVVRPSLPTVVLLLVAGLGLVPFGVWAVLVRFDFLSDVSVAAVIAVGAILAARTIRAALRLRELSIADATITIRSLVLRRVTHVLDASEVAELRTSEASYSSDTGDVANDVVSLVMRDGAEIPLVASDVNAPEVVAALESRLGLDLSAEPGHS